jgi:glycosyltransferase involved in cell wall biosynthesis
MVTRRHTVREPTQIAGTGAPAVVAGRHEPKKKLLYLAVCDPDLEVTGATVRMGAFVRYLAQYYDVTLVNMAGSGHRVEPAIEERFRDRDNRLGVTRRVRIDFSRPGYFLLSPALYRAANALLRKEPFDYLLADYGLAAVYGKLFSRRYDIPLIYSSHNLEHRMYRDLAARDFRRSVLAHYVYWAERAACQAAKLVITISENDRSQYAKWISNDRIVVIPQGFEPQVANPFYEAPAHSPPVVLFVGSFRSENNRLAARRIVEEIAPAVHRTRADVRFLLIGADPPGDLKGPNIECPGFVDDLNPHMNRANLVIAPMPFAHGMATKIVTAMAFGKTILATPEGAGAISRKYRQLVVAPLEAFPARIVELLATRPAIDRGQFTALCEEFSWSSLIARLHRRIEECCVLPTAAEAVKAKVCGGTPWQ